MAYFKYDGSAAAETAEPQGEIKGGDGVDTLTGGAGRDALFGGQGDLLIGGAADDTYWVLSPKDRIEEQAGAGVDRVIAYQNINLAKYANVENLIVDSPGKILAGNALDNIIVGGNGFQQLYGGAGQDVLVGGASFDIFIVIKGQGNDVIQDFTPTDGDMLRLQAGFTSFNQIQTRLTQTGADVKLDLGDGDAVLFRNLSVGSLSARNFQLQLDRATLGTQTFNEDFSGQLSLWDAESLPTGRWRPDMGFGGPDDFSNYNLNNGLQIYTSPYFRGHNGDFSASPFVSNGETLSIVAQPSSNAEIFGKPFISGMISTKPSFAQTYGYFEMRADVPEINGAWSAFWLSPSDNSWPPEADIMEVWGATSDELLTIKHSAETGQHTSEGMTQFSPNTAAGMHTYGLLWTSRTLTWYLDGVKVYETATPADMHKPMYMIANLAVTNNAGEPTGQPMPLTIDYIRAYALPGAPIPGGQTLTASNGGSVTGGAGNDTISGGPVADYLRGEDGADLMIGGPAFDDMNGNRGRDTLYGGGGNDWVVGGQDDDLLNGDEGNDVVYGNLGNDTVFGGAGDDWVRGGQGDDILDGGGGNDWLSGDRGNDVITGGSGADTFYFFDGSGFDVITDFRRSEGDRVLMDPGASYSARDENGDTVIQINGANILVLDNVSLASLGDGWIISG